MEKLYERIIFHNNTTPALNETNLNLLSKAVDDIDDRVVDLADDILEVVPQIETYLDQAEDLYEAMENLSKYPPYIGENGDWYVWDIESSQYVDSEIDASITVQVADVTMLAYGSSPYVTNTGTDTDPIFHLFIPRAAGISQISKTSTSGLEDTYTITTQDGATFTFKVTNGKSITKIEKTSTSGLTDTYTITYNDSTTDTYNVINGKGISQIAKTSTAGLVDTYTITYTDGTSSTYTVTNGADGTDGTDGEDGRGIVSIIKTGTSGLVDTYTITYTDNTTSTFTVTNGADGSGSGDMLKSDYDPNSTVKNAGGIPSYVAGQIPTVPTKVSQLQNDSGYITGLAWSGVSSKPFNTVGTGLNVDGDNALNADIYAVDVDHNGTASASGVRKQRIHVNTSYSDIDGTMYMEQTLTVSTSADTTYTFSNAAITTSSVIDVYASVWGITPSNVVVTNGQCVVTIPKQSSAISLGIRIYIK